MDSRATVTAPPVPGPARLTLTGDQAIFTSLRTPTGEGYRIVGASGGLTADEKAELVTRCPSHGGLASPAEDATALAAFPLRSGRHCVAWIRYAGVEHTARGGLRVYSHLFICSAADYARCELDFLRVAAALRNAAADQPPLKSLQRLEELTLELGPPRPSAAGAAGHAAATVAALLEERTVVACGVAADESLARAVWRFLPYGWRRNTAVSLGLKFAQSRQMRLVLVPSEVREAQRAAAGVEIAWIDTSAAERGPEELSPWPRLLLRWWNEGRGADVRRITGELDGSDGAARLAHAAGLYEDLDRVATADLEQLGALREKYAAASEAATPERNIVQRILSAVQARTAALAESAPIAG